jgi:hypothetical protein
VSVIAREPDDSGGPACDCGSTAVIDANRHDWRCARRLWIERGDARTELRGAVRRIAALERERDELAQRLRRASANAEAAEAEVERLTGGQ